MRQPPLRFIDLPPKGLPRLWRGQSLFELVVALGIGALVLVGLMRVSTTSINNIIFSRTQAQATRLAEEAAEWLREERDKDWDTFRDLRANGIAWCLNTLDWSQAQQPGCTGEIAGTSFARETTLTSDLSATKIDVLVRVYWTDNLGTHEVRLDSRLTNWREQ